MKDRTVRIQWLCDQLNDFFPNFCIKTFIGVDHQNPFAGVFDRSECCVALGGVIVESALKYPGAFIARKFYGSISAERVKDHDIRTPCAQRANAFDDIALFVERKNDSGNHCFLLS